MNRVDHNGEAGTNAAGWAESTVATGDANARLARELNAELEADRAQVRATTTREEVEAEWEAARAAWDADQSDENGQRLANASAALRAWA